jgi:Asp-tRNA(Asn)/Glu-tRNA(Gln) amidotransferase A subunit family amidase
MTVPQSLARLTAVELAAGMASGVLSAQRVAREHLDRIAEREPSVGAWVHLDPDYIMNQARELDRAANTGRRSIDITVHRGTPLAWRRCAQPARSSSARP